MRLTGEIAIDAPIGVVWGLVVDPTSIASCIPGVQGVRRLDPNPFEGTLNASVGPIDGEFAFAAVLADQLPPERLTVAVRGTDSVTKSRLTADVEIALTADAVDRTTLTYRATLTVEGRLAILGEMVLRATAGAMIGQVTGCLRKAVEGTPRPEATG